MNSNKINSTDIDVTQDGPISGDIGVALVALSEMIQLLPDENIIEARRLLRGLFDCKDRVKSLEHIAIILPQAEKEGVCHV